MKKSIIALAVASAIAAPAAMADVTLYGVLSMDFIHTSDTAVDTSVPAIAAKESNSQIQRDDVIIGIKGSSTTDGGLMVNGEIKTEKSFTDPTLAYINVGSESTKLWAGKFANPANGADSAALSDSRTFANNAGTGLVSNIGHFTDELDNAAAVSYSANGLTAAVGSFTQNNTDQTDGSVVALGYAANGLSVNAGYETRDGAYDVTGVKVGYAVDALSASVYYVSSDFNATTTDPAYSVDTTGLTVGYKMGATSLLAIYNNDDVDGGELDMYGVQVKQNLGGGLSAYAEYSNTDGSGDLNDYKASNYTVGMSFAF